MVIFEPWAVTAPSGSCPGRRKELAMAERVYPATSAGWQVTQRAAPVGAGEGCAAEMRASCSAVALPTD